MKDVINTALMPESRNIESLSEAQIEAVRRMRRKAGARGVSVYTLGVLDTRDMAKLQRLTDGKRLAMLSPATREVLIAEVRECTHPWDPKVVAVWSAWCEHNNVQVEENLMQREQVIQQQEDKRLDSLARNRPRHYQKGARDLAKEAILKVLSDGQEHTSNEVYAADERVGQSTLQRVARDMGVHFRVTTGLPPTGGRRSFWSLPSKTPSLVLPPIPPAQPNRRSSSSIRRLPGARENMMAKLREFLSDGNEHLLADVEDAMKEHGGHTLLYSCAAKLGVLRRYEGSLKGGRISYWSLPMATIVIHEAPVSFKPNTREDQNLPLKEIKDQKLSEIKKIAERYGCAPVTLARWTEMEMNHWGNPYGQETLPDRESDEGIQLAERVFVIAMPLGPVAIARREFRIKSRRKA